MKLTGTILTALVLAANNCGAQVQQDSITTTLPQDDKGTTIMVDQVEEPAVDSFFVVEPVQPILFRQDFMMIGPAGEPQFVFYGCGMMG